MSGGWHDRDVPTTSILNISTKGISVVIFSVLVHQMCVLNTKKLVIAYLFSFRETSYGRPKNVPKWSCSVTSLGHPQDVNLNIFHQNRTISGCPRDVVCWLGRDLEIATPRPRIYGKFYPESRTMRILTRTLRPRFQEFWPTPQIESGAGLYGPKHLPNYFDIWRSTKKLENI